MIEGQGVTAAHQLPSGARFRIELAGTSDLRSYHARARKVNSAIQGACFHTSADYTCPMATIIEVEKLALDLSENERAVLAAHLLGSLPPVLYDADEGIAEALRRDADLEANPSGGLSLEQVDQQIKRRRT